VPNFRKLPEYFLFLRIVFVFNNLHQYTSSRAIPGIRRAMVKQTPQALEFSIRDAEFQRRTENPRAGGVEHIAFYTYRLLK